MFRGKESSNIIELSRLVQDLLNFGVSGSLRLWGWGVVGGAFHTCAHACACMNTHARTRMRGKHDNFMQMAAPIGEYLGIPYDVIRACVRIRVHVHMGGVHPLTTPHPIHPPPTPQGGPPESFKIQ